MAPQFNRQMLEDDQVRLSEQLQLLHHFGYSDLDMHYQVSSQFSNKHTRDYDTSTTIRILDTIAVALTTGRPGEVFAAAFDTCRGITLVLAKNDGATNEDDQAIRELIRLITTPTPTARDFLPFLFTRCGENIAKRIMRMDDAVRDFSHDLEEVLRCYTPVSSIDKEFPYSTDYRNLQYRDQQIPFVQMMRDLLTVIKDKVQVFNLQNLSATPDLYTRYAQLVLVALVLKRSRLLRSLCESTRALDDDRKLQAERLKRRLAKVCQYYHGIQDLIKHTRRYVSQGITYRWVDSICDTGETTFDLEGDYLKAITRALGNVSPSEDTLATLRRKFPNMGQMWRRSCSVTTRLHVEIRILLHLSNPVCALDHSHQQPIGCSKRSCLCCTLWIWKYNAKFETKWLTSGSHGKAYAAWALPGSSYDHVRVTGGRSGVDAAVLEGVQERLSDTLTVMFPHQRRLSDEHRWSGSESEDSGSEDERMVMQRELANRVAQFWHRL